MEEDNKKEFKKEFIPRKIIIKFEGDMIDFNDFKRSELLEGYDENLDQPKSGLRLIFVSYPFSKDYWWLNDEIRDMRVRHLETKLQAARVTFL